MMPATICKAIEIKAPIERVWAYIGTAAGLRQWWQSDIQLEAKQGGSCEERSSPFDDVCVRRGVVTTYDPPRRLTLTFHDNPDHDDVQPHVTIISITLQEEGEATRVTVWHQITRDIAIQSHPASVPHGDNSAETAQVPEIFNQLQPLEAALPHGDTNLTRPAIRGENVDTASWHVLYTGQWAQRLERLKQLALPA